MCHRYKSKLTPIILCTIIALVSQISKSSKAEDVKTNALQSVDSNLPHPEVLLEGLTLELVAEHPDLATPTGIDIGKDGSIWVVSNHTHFRPENYKGPAKDEILRFSSDGKRSVFFSESENTMDLELGFNHDVYIAQRDKILRLIDRDGDLKCDEIQTIIQLETEATYPHNGLSGLTWSPQGDLVFSIGENFANPWELTGSDNKTLSGSGEGGIFICSPRGESLRRFAYGFWNPFGLCFRDGNLFAAENDPGSRPPCRLLHVVDGGDYGYQRKYGNASHHPFVCWNGELRGTLPMMHALGEAPCGITPFEAGLAVTSWTEHRLDYYPLRKAGETFSTQRISMLQGDRDFRPTCLAVGNSKDLYFTDWVKGSYEIHGKGRIWQLKYDPTITSKWSNQSPSDPTTNDTSTKPPQSESRSITRLLQLAKNEIDPFAHHRIISSIANRISVNGEDPNEIFEKVDQSNEEDLINLILALKMVNPSDKELLERLLKHPSQNVQFEALRWIAAEDIKELLPNVNQCMKAEKINFQTFEAALATVNTLNGKPDLGVVNQEMLLQVLSEPSTNLKVKVNVLKLIDPDPKRFSETQWLKIKNEEEQVLLRELVRTIITKPSEESSKFLISVANDPSISAAIRADAITSLRPNDDRARSAIFELVLHEDQEIRDEAIRALRFTPIDDNERDLLLRIRTERPESSELIDATIDPESMKNSRSTWDTLDDWKQRLNAVKGPANLDKGRRIFHHAGLANCGKCHRHLGRGTNLGPDLSAVSKAADQDHLLMSLLKPSERIDPQYHSRSLLMEDGRTFTGILLRDGGGGREVYRNLNGEEQVLNTEEIVQRKELATSLMPEGLLDQLTLREIRDLLAFVSHSTPQKTNTRPVSPSDISLWEGDWWLDFPDGYGGWVRFREDNPTSAELLWRVGSPRPVEIEVIDPWNLKLRRRSKKSQSTYLAQLDNETITIRNASNIAQIATGGKCPPMPSRPDLASIRFGEPIHLFNGNNLDGWLLQPANAKNGWQAKEGILTNTTPKTDFSAYGDFGNLKTSEVFGDCQLHLEFRIGKDCNSGIYINGLYEAQVVDRNSKMQGISGPGAIFGRLTPSSNAGYEGGRWQTYDIMLVDRHVTVRLNNKMVIDNQAVEGCTGGALFGNVSREGPLYLQGDHTSVEYRNIWIRRRVDKSQ